MANRVVDCGMPLRSPARTAIVTLLLASSVTACSSDTSSPMATFTSLPTGFTELVARTDGVGTRVVKIPAGMNSLLIDGSCVGTGRLTVTEGEQGAGGSIACARDGELATLMGSVTVTADPKATSLTITTDSDTRWRLQVGGSAKPL